jgi:alpha-D-xyloside xylohydrolase
VFLGNNDFLIFDPVTAFTKREFNARPLRHCVSRQDIDEAWSTIDQQKGFRMIARWRITWRIISAVPVVFLLALFLAPSCALATADGNLSNTDADRDERGITIRANSTVTRIEIWSEGVIRVIHKPAGAAEMPKSLTVVAKPQGVSWKLEEAGDALFLSTRRMVVRVDKSTGAVSVMDGDRRPVLSESAHGTWLSTVTAGSAKGTITAGQTFELAPDESIYGLGQHPEGASLDYVGSSIQLLQENTKVAVPVLLSSRGYALLWDNPSVTNVDVGKTDPHTVRWLSEAGGGVDYYIFAGPQPDQAIAEYRWLTGSAPMFPLWTWGFWQSRERYKTQDEILGIAAEYRKRGIPFDGIIQDWQYWPPLNQETAQGGWGSHEFDPARYPNPAEMIQTLHDEHVHMMVVSWAKFDVTNSGVSIPNLRELEAVKGAYTPAIPYVYPAGRGKWYDPFNAEARKVYAGEMMKKLFSLGVDAWWLDASEAELSGTWGEFRNFKTAMGSGALVFNAYPLEHTRAVYEGQRAQSSDKRVFILTRSAYAGQQRHGAVTWSGDISGKWDVFQHQIPAGLNFVASGIPYWNTDIGGFFGSNPDDPKYTELFTRWFQFGAFNPMFRVHGTDKPKEVWRFDPATQKILTDTIDLRYHLLPYIYSVSWMVTHDGYTMMRPLVMDFRGDATARRIGDQFMFGPAFLVNPVTQPGEQTRHVYLPQGTRWIDFWTGSSLDGGKTIDAPAPISALPLYVRAGSIVPYGPTVQWASEKPNAPIELRIYPGADGEFTLYEDEGDNYNYEHGDYATVNLRWDDKTHALTIGARKGSYPGMSSERVFNIVLVSQGHGNGIALTEKFDRSVTYRGPEVRISCPGRGSSN